MDHELKQTKSGWEAETRIDLGFDRRELRIITHKHYNGGVYTTAQCVTLTDIGYQCAIGYGKPESGDYSKTLARDTTLRATKGNVDRMHKRAMLDADAAVAEAKLYYEKQRAAQKAIEAAQAQERGF